MARLLRAAHLGALIAGLLLLPFSPQLAIAASSSEIEAKQEYDRAVSAYKARDFSGALPHFRKAYQLSNRRPSSILMLAACEAELQMVPQAIGHYREYLSTVRDPEEARRVESTIAFLENPGTHKAGSNTPGRNPTPRGHPPAPIAAIDPTPLPTPAPPTTLGAIAPTTTEPADSSLLSSPYLWVGVGLAVIAGSVAVAFAVDRSPELYGGNTGVVLRR